MAFVLPICISRGSSTLHLNCRTPFSRPRLAVQVRYRVSPRCSALVPPPDPPGNDSGSSPRSELHSDQVQHVQLSTFVRVSSLLTNLFPVWILVASALAMRRPDMFTSLMSPTVVQSALSLLMLSTGLTLTPNDLIASFRKPRPILFAFISCYVFMPLLAVGLSAIFKLDSTLRAGLLLLSIISGGQASNLCTHIAGGDTALSVTMTTATTLSAALILPFLSSILLGAVVPVDQFALALSTARVTLLPIVIGASFNRLFPGPVLKIQPVLPLTGIAAVILCVLGPVAQSATMFMSSWRSLLFPVLLLHVIGGIIGFVGPILAQAGSATAITTAFETAFKSPALSYVLAKRHFPSGVETASVISIVILAPIAALFAVLLRMFRNRASSQETTKR